MLRRSMLDDKIFEIQMKKNQNEVDKALLEKAKREMDAIDKDITTIQAQVQVQGK